LLKQNVRIHDGSRDCPPKLLCNRYLNLTRRPDRTGARPDKEARSHRRTGLLGPGPHGTRPGLLRRDDLLLGPGQQLWPELGGTVCVPVAASARAVLWAARPTTACWSSLGKMVFTEGTYAAARTCRARWAGRWRTGAEWRRGRRILPAVRGLSATAAGVEVRKGSRRVPEEEGRVRRGCAQ
jgi:hypothetical protein